MDFLANKIELIERIHMWHLDVEVEAAMRHSESGQKRSSDLGRPGTLSLAEDYYTSPAPPRMLANPEAPRGLHHERRGFGFSGYHLALTAVGGAIILAYWLPRWVTRREPAASGLLILLGMAAFALVPGVPEVPDPRVTPAPWEIVAEITVIIALFGTGLRIDNLSSLSRWGPTIRLLVLAMPLTILAVAVMGHAIAGMTRWGARSCWVP